MGKLQGLQWSPKWVSHLGCVKGCLDYLGLKVTDAWLYGATGHAFVLNVHGELCPSGPTAWNTGMTTRLGRNVGYESECVLGFGMDEKALAEKQQEAWAFVRSAIDQGVPCYGWELEIPEFYVVNGYDDVGYYYSGANCDTGKGPKSWQELGASEIGLIEMYSVTRGQPAGDAQTVEEALSFALEIAQSPPKWIHPGYTAGVSGFDVWIQAHETGKADGFGTAYNAAVWSECRGYAVHFLEEARGRLAGQPDGLFDEAIGHYRTVAEGLEMVAGAFPFQGLEPEHIQDAARVEAAVKALRAARDAEAAGLQALQGIVEAL